MKKYQRDAIKLATEILSQPEFKPSRYSPPRWCLLRAVSAECNQLRREQCQLCQWFKKSGSHASWLPVEDNNEECNQA